ncbi:MAG: hypothetical protein HY063_02900 [Bacteroidetes bacterium]|nr:hypothetical protein [Bacteroidota bacterium]
MKKIILLAAILSVVEGSFCFSQQESEQYIRKGLIRSMATISPGILLKENASTISLHGNLEYYVADNISLRGDSYYFLKAKDNNGNNPFDFNHSTFAGASFHFKTKNHFDPYFAFEPGVSIARINYTYSWGFEQYEWRQSNIHVNPLISSAIGFNFYFQKFFHLFMEGRYVYGKDLSNVTIPLSLSELRFSFGLGWNLNLIKKK